MKKIIYLSCIVCFVLACATTGKIGESRLDKLSRQCKEEQLNEKPDHENFQNLSTRERNRKRKELKEFKKNRIALYQHIHTFKSLYPEAVNSDGYCSGESCKKLMRLRQLIIEACPGIGQKYPVIKTR